MKSSAFFKLFLLACTLSLMIQVTTCNLHPCVAIPACRAAVPYMWLHGQPNSQPVLRGEPQGCQLDQVALPWPLALGSQHTQNFKLRLHQKMLLFLVKLWVGWRLTAETLPR